MSTILEKIAAQKKRRIEERLKITTREVLRDRALHTPTAEHSFAQAVGRADKLNLIGEIKKASPSKGIIQNDFHPVAQAEAYVQAGVSAISVLTEEDFFLGKDEYLTAVGEKVSVPLLRKDFVIDMMQISEARILGASAVLLIAALLNDRDLHAFMAEAEALALDVLLEVHDERELERGLKLGASIIGINNRDLKTFQIDLGTTERLAGMIPEGKIIVAESGIHTAEDMDRVQRAGAQAVLIGESLMRAAGSAQSVQDKIKELMRSQS